MDVVETMRPDRASSTRARTLDVVVVNYRSAGILDASLAATLRFTGGAARFILVDNSPGDGAAEAVTNAIPGSTVISNPHNVGFAAAVNQGIQAGTGELVLLLNPDILEIAGGLETVRKLFDDQPRLAAVAALLKNPDGTIQKLCRTELQLFDLLSAELSLPQRMPWWEAVSRARMPEWDYLSRREVDVACGAWLCLRRAALDDVGLFDERFFVYWEETDWLIRAKHNGWKTLFTPEVEVTHSGRASTGAESDELGLLYLESLQKYTRKHHGGLAALALRATLLGFDSARWTRSFAKRLPNRPQIERRLAVHATGQAPAALRRGTSSKPNPERVP
ncbi:MAG: glycosyltransferase family 2 protein [Gaiellaceae bacterium]